LSSHSLLCPSGEDADEEAPAPASVSSSSRPKVSSLSSPAFNHASQVNLQNLSIPRDDAKVTGRFTPGSGVFITRKFLHSELPVKHDQQKYIGHKTFAIASAKTVMFPAYPFPIEIVSSKLLPHL
jgi:hypothetical protein